MPSPKPVMPQEQLTGEGVRPRADKRQERDGTTRAVKCETQKSEAEILCVEIDEGGQLRLHIQPAQTTGREKRRIRASCEAGG